MNVEIFTDGSCSGNPGPGGWGAILRAKGVTKEMSGGAADTTNNRMELTAVIEALAALKYPCDVTVTTDSKYVVDSVEKGWARSWKKTNWKQGKAKNPDLWDRLLTLLDTHRVTFKWIKGHNGHEENERCDRLAVAKTEQYKNGEQTK
jgi:ribonuclease HI